MPDVVTGATGFLGTHLVAALRAQNRGVRCLVRRRSVTRELAQMGAELAEVDLLDSEALVRALKGADRVFHLAGGGNVSAMTEGGLEILRSANLAPLQAVVRASTAAAVGKVILYSSISAMGVHVGVRLDEEMPCVPKTPHEIVKEEGERVAFEAWKKDGLPVVVLRPTMVYGPRDLRSEIPRLVRLARRGLVPLFSGGRGAVPWVYVSDVIDGTLAAAERPGAIGRTYILGAPEPYRFADVVREIAKALGRRRGGFTVPDFVARPGVTVVEAVFRALGRDPPFTRHRLDSLSGRRMVDIGRARRELGYVPRVDLEEGMQRTVRWYLENGVV